LSATIAAIMKRRLRQLCTYNAVVEALGGPVAVGRLTGQTCAAVCNWRSYNGLFPTKYYFTLQDALADRGYSAPRWLWGFYEAGENKQAA
jgi:hypothetical protein